MGQARTLTRRLEAFAISGGAKLLDPTNEWEMVRFRTCNGVCIIYRTKDGSVSFNGQPARDAFNAFQKNTPWSAVDIIRRTKRSKVESVLLERDGNRCFYCGHLMAEPTLEHILSIAHGGNNHLSNLVLACQSCNATADNLPVIDKVRLREFHNANQSVPAKTEINEPHA